MNKRLNFSAQLKLCLYCVLMLIVLCALVVVRAYGAYGTSGKTNEGSAMASIEALRWQHRVIVAHCDNTAIAEHLVADLQAQAEAVDDRDIRWFVLSPAGLITNGEGVKPRLRSELGRYDFREQSAAPVSVVLIGKDGGIKAQHSRLNADALFALIDTMPMRQREMRQ